jgi:polyisoprenoid-binding protein YceI
MAKQNWKLDPLHSEIQFKIKHLLISTVTGNLDQISSDFTQEKDDFTDAEIDFTADIDSINTGNEQRDGHLKSAEFFDVEKFPKIEFKSSSFEKVKDDQYLLHGNLTMKGITKPIVLNVEFGGIAVDGYQQTKSGFSFDGSLNRKDYGLSWGGLTDAGGAVLGDEVKISGSFQFIKQA